jgi:hypothetical protein
MFRTALLIAVLFLALGFAAQAKFVEKITEQAYVEFGFGGSIGYSEILVASKWAKRPERAPSGLLVRMPSIGGVDVVPR